MSQVEGKKKSKDEEGGHGIGKGKVQRQPGQSEKSGKSGKPRSKHPMRENRGKPQQQHGFVSHSEDTICLCCRQRGHTMATCPKNPNRGEGEGKGGARIKSKLTCFNCGM